MKLTVRLAGLLALAALPSCVDLAPSEIPPVRYLTIAPRTSAPTVKPSEPAEPRLFIGRVTAAESIDDRLVRRSSPFELRYDEFARWAEPPVSSLQRALDDELFRSGRFVRGSVGGRRLDVELVDFEERFSPRHVGVVTLLVSAVTNDGTVVLDARVGASELIDGEDPALAAKALTAALYSAVLQLSDRLALP